MFAGTGDASSVAAARGRSGAGAERGVDRRRVASSMSERVKGRLEPLGFLARLCQPPFDLAAQLSSIVIAGRA
jgi:hypothetical protein